MSIFKEEIFGPVLTITHYHDYEHALDIANNTDYGLAAYVSGIEKKDLLKLSKRLRTSENSLFAFNLSFSGPDLSGDRCIVIGGPKGNAEVR